MSWVIFITVLIGMNVIAYFASFVWGERKPWFFWACLSLTAMSFLLPFMA